MRLILITILFTAALGTLNSQVNDTMQRKPLELVFKEYQQELLTIPGVQGFYQSVKENGEECIVIMIDEYTDSIKEALPDSLEGYPVNIEVTGEIKPLGNKKKSPEE